MKKIKFILIIVILIMIVTSTVFYFFYKNTYKTMKLGNNITKSAENIKEYILNISSYQAEISVEVNSNKNVNKYIIKQQYAEPNIFKQEVIEPTNIKGLKTIYDGINLKIENTQLNLSEIYEKYQYISENALCLYTFIKDYKQNSNSKYIEENDQIIMETKVENSSNKYICYKKLYIDKKNAKPIKLEIQDINKKMLVYIVYKEIKINSIDKEEILAFNLKEINTNI